MSPHSKSTKKMQQASADIERAIELFEQEAEFIKKKPEEKKLSINLATFEKIKSQLKSLS